MGSMLSHNSESNNNSNNNSRQKPERSRPPDDSEGDTCTSTRLQSGNITFVIDDDHFEELEITPSLQEVLLVRQQSRDSVMDLGYHSYYSKSHAQDNGAAKAAPPTNLLLETLDKWVWKTSSAKEVHNVESIVESYVEQILQDMKEIDKKWDFRLIKCGSYYEGLRVGYPFEFDYMLEIVSLQAIQIKPNENQPLGEIEVIMASTDESLMEEPLLQFKVQMIPPLRECIRRRDNFRGLKFLEVNDHYNKPNICLFFQLKDMGVMIDLVPCVKFPYHQRHKLPRYLDDTLAFAKKVIPGAESEKLVSEFISNNLYLVATTIHCRWRISTSVVEMHIMKNLHENLKKPLRVLKYLCNTHLVHSESFSVRHIDPRHMLRLFGYKSFVPSYVIKLLFLHHVAQFYNEKDCQSPGMYHNDSTGILQLLIRDLKRFKSFINLPVERCHIEINSTFFGDLHKHKFDFVQDLVFRTVSKNIGWYDHMVNTMELILDEEIDESDIPALKRKFRMLNYPPLQNVKCYMNQGSDL